MGRTVPGGQYAFRIVNFGSPEVRDRFARGVLVNPDGYPEWKLFARAMVRLPEPPRGLTIDEVRVVDVLAANALLSRGDDALWQAPRPRAGTPQGWTWAHTGLARQLALVPTDLHASYRHAGGVRTMAVDRAERGLRIEYEPRRVPVHQVQPVPEDLMARLDGHLGVALPPGYRRFLAQTNGAAPGHAGVLRGYGFVADQRLFGLGRDDAAQDLGAANRYLADRFTDEFLAIGYVQGGMLLVKVRGADTDSVWYWDDDDERDEQGYDARRICATLLHRCAADIGEFWDRLWIPAGELLDLASAWVDGAQVEEVRPRGTGDCLPAGYRAAWQPEPIPDEEYFGNPVIQLALLRPEPA